MDQTTYITEAGEILKSFDDFGLRKTERTQISEPVRDVRRIRPAGVNGDRNITRLMGFPPTYAPRTVTDTYVFIKHHRDWETIKTRIYEKINGGPCHLIVDGDAWYYWDGDVSVTEPKNGRDLLTLKIVATVFPYKYERFSSVEDWLWDQFDFRTGIIRNYRGIAVDGTKTLTIPCLDLPVIPGFWTASSGISVSYGGVTGALTQRDAAAAKTYEQFAGIVLPGGEQMLTFTGTGTVDVFYRGGRL